MSSAQSRFDWISGPFSEKKEQRGSGEAQQPVDAGAEYCEYRDRGLRELAAGRFEEAMKALGRAL